MTPIQVSSNSLNNVILSASQLGNTACYTEIAVLLQTTSKIYEL